MPSVNKSLPKSCDLVNEQETINLLSAIGSEKLLRHWEGLAPAQKQRLALQIEQIDIPTFRLQQQLIDESQTKNRAILPFTHYSKAGNNEDKLTGKKMIAEGLVGCLIVAGGQGSRLRIDGPKGLCKVTKVRQKSLFQLFAEKTLAAGIQAGRMLPLAIMTSPLNHDDTINFFEENAYFGLDKNQISFFSQEMLPLLDTQGNLFLETTDHLSEGPDGNGGALHQFYKSGLWNDWHSKGVRYLNFVLIDNALADPFDTELVGYQKRMNSDVVVKCTKRKNPDEKVGILAIENGKAVVVEYSEISRDEQSALDDKGNLRYLLANLSLFSFEMDFIKQIATTTQPILHKAFKAVNFLDVQGKTIKPELPMAWKFEKFIFDVLPEATKVDALVYPREECFAPLKNFSGSDSFETVADALEKRDRQVLEEIIGNPCDVTPLEISQDFYYPTPELLQKWKQQVVDNDGYVES